MSAPTKITLSEKLSQFSDLWAPRVVATFNGHDIMIVKVQGSFVRHAHADTDDLFLVLKGRLTIRLSDGDVTLEEGELLVIPRGVEHEPYAEEETQLLIMERAGTPNTGDPTTAAPRREL